MRHPPRDLPGDLFFAPVRVFRNQAGTDHLLGEAPHPESHCQPLGGGFGAKMAAIRSSRTSSVNARCSGALILLTPKSSIALLSYSPSPLRGGGWGEGLSCILPCLRRNSEEAEAEVE